MNKLLGTTLGLLLAAVATVVVRADLADVADLKVGTTGTTGTRFVRSAGLQASHGSRFVRSAGLQASHGSRFVRSAGLQASHASRLVRDGRLQASQAGQTAGPLPASAVLSKYCVTCHNQKRKTAGLEIDTLDLQNVGAHAETWEKIARKVRTHEMPPPGVARPDNATYDAVTAYIENALDAAALAQPHGGRVPVHRLNRTEYANAIRDLLGLDVDARRILPADEADVEGFDNVASVLTVSPALLENYLSAARMISRLAVGDTSRKPMVDVFKVERDMVQDERMSEDLPFGSRGGTAVTYQFPVDGEYLFKIELKRQLYDYLIGMGEPHQLDVRLDGVLLKRFTVGGEGKGMTTPENFAGNTPGDPEWEHYMLTADRGLEVRTPVKAGPHVVGVSFVRRLWEGEGILQPPQTGFGRTTNELYFGYPALKTVSIGGPFNVVGPGESPTRRGLFVCAPKSTAAEEPCARKILSAVATRAYRRPVTESETEVLLDFYRSGRAEEKTFDAGIQRGLERILAAPSFIFRVNRPAERNLNLASRLSFFLWSSIPDDELLNTAIRGKLSEPAVLEQQVKRMLRDPRANALIEGFATRWLELGKIAGFVPDTQLYPEFDENLREAMAEETRLFVADQLRQDRSVVDLVLADYTFANDRLARHYGIPDVYGSHYRPVKFTDGRRGGLLGQASVLAVTSYPNRTSVVLRGRWLLANMLGAPPPPPPLDVPALKEPGEEGQPKSLRERMEVHRKNPACASCHQRMDPLGFTLENFDATGKWRTDADGVPVDPNASLPDGTRFAGVEGLRAYLAAHKEDFVRTLGAKLLTYAIGRGIEYYDQPAIRKIARDAAAQDYRWSSVIIGVVNSTPFRSNE
jgi:mono/diheme cytochrome c family protein